MKQTISKIGVVGTGVIGASWSALFLARGFQVVASDPAENAETFLRAYVTNAWPAMEQLGIVCCDDDPQHRLTFSNNLEAVAGVDFIQENGPERLPLKRQLYQRLDALLPPDVLIATSSSGLSISEIQQACDRYPQRCLTAHPFNPPHLVPLVELVAGKATDPQAIDRAQAFYTAAGKRTIRLKKEVPGHVANRLQGVLMREIMSLVNEGVVSVADADAACSWGPGLRWGIMGPVLLNHLGGGEEGIAHFYDQFAQAMVTWWTPLNELTFTRQVRQKMIDGLHEELAGRSFAELAAERDSLLITLLKARQLD